MLRMYFVQHWFNLADEACEEALLDSTALRRFVGIDLGRERVPDGTTLLKFRRLVEDNDLGEELLATVGQVLRVPINHFEGNYVCDAATLQELRDNDRVVLRYVDNPNGSLALLAIPEPTSAALLAAMLLVSCRSRAETRRR